MHLSPYSGKRYLPAKSIGIHNAFLSRNSPFKSKSRFHSLDFDLDLDLGLDVDLDIPIR